MGSRDGLEVVCELPQSCFAIVFSVSIVTSSSMSYKWNYIYYIAF